MKFDVEEEKRIGEREMSSTKRSKQYEIHNLSGLDINIYEFSFMTGWRKDHIMYSLKPNSVTYLFREELKSLIDNSDINEHLLLGSLLLQAKGYREQCHIEDLLCHLVTIKEKCEEMIKDRENGISLRQARYQSEPININGKHKGMPWLPRHEQQRDMIEKRRKTSRRAYPLGPDPRYFYNKERPILFKGKPKPEIVIRRDDLISFYEQNFPFDDSRKVKRKYHIRKPTVINLDRGIIFLKVPKKWRAMKNIGKVRHYIGTFNTKEEAQVAMKNYLHCYNINGQVGVA